MIIEHSGGAFYTSAGKHCGVIITTGLAQFLKPLHTDKVNLAAKLASRPVPHERDLWDGQRADKQ